MSSEKRLLSELARLYGIQTVYHDVERRPKQADTDSLLAILTALGAPIKSLKDVPSALRQRRQSMWRNILEPVTVAGDGNLVSVPLRLPENRHNITIACHLTLEDGEQTDMTYESDRLPTSKVIEVEGTTYSVKALPIQKQLGFGYHRLSIDIDGKQIETLVISAPVRTHTPSENKSWGVFLPLYSLHSGRSWGAGDFNDLQSLIEWVAEMGGKVVASLPLLSAFLDKPYEPSPYIPASRLFWNEFYIDTSTVPESDKCPASQRFLNSLSFQREIDVLRKSDLVDYGRQMALKRVILQELAQCLLDTKSNRQRNFSRFVKMHPRLADYARFRATLEAQYKSWKLWPQRLRKGDLRDGDYDATIKHYHEYVQWLADEQLHRIAENARRKGIRLYLDLPLGTHPDGYDTWRYQENFVPGVSVGAPPDTVFTQGQNWTFQPLYPDAIRQTGYQYVVACLQHHLECAGILRIDHIMSLHRLFFIPDGMESSRGVYVRYHPEEMYAILALESLRHGALIVGEDLGIVPGEVRQAMRHHSLHRMYVMHYELAGDAQPLLHPVPRNTIASLNTHDMPPFASAWRGQDIIDRLKAGILNQTSAHQEKIKRASINKRLSRFLKDTGRLQRPVNEINILNGCLDFLSASQTDIVLVNLEDTWLETRMQNIPSTTREHPNWRRKARYDLDIFCKMPQVLAILKEVNDLRLSRSPRHASKKAPSRD